MKTELTEEQIAAYILQILKDRACWGSRYMPLDTIVNWLAKRVKKNGKRVKAVIKMLTKERYIWIHKKGETISLNPTKSMEIVEYIERIRETSI